MDITVNGARGLSQSFTIV